MYNTLYACIIYSGKMKHVCPGNNLYTVTSFSIVGYDYKITTSTVMFEPSIGTVSQQQCLEIEIIQESLSEDQEVLTLLLSTNNSAVTLTTYKVVLYITANNGKAILSKYLVSQAIPHTI